MCQGRFITGRFTADVRPINAVAAILSLLEAAKPGPGHGGRNRQSEVGQSGDIEASSRNWIVSAAEDTGDDVAGRPRRVSYNPTLATSGPPVIAALLIFCRGTE